MLRTDKFKSWLKKHGYKRKMRNDFRSRINRINKSLTSKKYSIKNQYKANHCAYLLSLFKNMGRNKGFNKVFGTNFPTGTKQLEPIKYALRKYVEFLDDTKR